MKKSTYKLVKSARMARESWGKPLQLVNICHLCAKKCKGFGLDTSECFYFEPEKKL